MIDDAIQIQAAGSTLTTSGTSQSVAIPNTASGTKPKYVRIQVTTYAFIKFGNGAGTAATSSDILVSPNESELYKVSGNTHVAAIQQAGAGLVNITALEDS